MKIIIAPDSFKGSMSASMAAGAIEAGIKRAMPEAETVKLPMADGGEGTVEAVFSIIGGRMVTVPVVDPLGYKVDANYCITEDGIAFIEMAQASGLTLVPEEERNVMCSSSYGTGQLIKDALDKDCRKIYVGIGGSATNDGGTGMAQALGACFIGDKWRLLSGSGENLGKIRRIDASHMDERLKDTEFVVLCDVSNPLCGPDGASFVYGPQKGADAEQVKVLDEGMKNYADILMRDLKADVADIPGAGAAGGMGVALMAFCGAKLVSGADALMELYDFDEKIKGVDLVITGEGKTDASSLSGKAPQKVIARAKKLGIRTALLSGIIESSGCDMMSLGVSAAASVVSGEITAEMSMSKAVVYTAETAEKLIKALFRS